jgi:hypothetical protein
VHFKLLILTYKDKVIKKLVSYEESADVTGGKPIAVWSQYILGVSAVNPLVAFYDIYVRKRKKQEKRIATLPELLFFFLSQTPHET